MTLEWNIVLVLAWFLVCYWLLVVGFGSWFVVEGIKVADAKMWKKVGKAGAFLVCVLVSVSVWFCVFWF